MPDFLLQGMTNSVKFTFSVGGTTCIVYNWYCSSFTNLAIYTNIISILYVYRFGIRDSNEK